LSSVSALPLPASVTLTGRETLLAQTWDDHAVQTRMRNEEARGRDSNPHPPNDG
jgi:hypothetical protein